MQRIEKERGRRKIAGAVSSESNLQVKVVNFNSVVLLNLVTFPDIIKKGLVWEAACPLPVLIYEEPRLIILCIKKSLSLL